MYYNPMQMYKPEQVIKVNGDNGARALQMAPNSSALVLDENTPTIFFCQTDGAGYKTITPYSITPKLPPEKAEIKDILNRLTKLEERLNEPNTKSNETEQPKPNVEIVKRDDEWKWGGSLSRFDE